MNNIKDTIILIALVAVLTMLAALHIVGARTHLLMENVQVTQLMGGCELWSILPPTQPEQTLVLACPRMDKIRLWPLPVQQPWSDDNGAGEYQQANSGMDIIGPVETAQSDVGRVLQDGAILVCCMEHSDG